MTAASPFPNTDLVQKTRPKTVYRQSLAGVQVPAFTGSFVLMVFAVLLISNYFGRPFELVFKGLHIPGILCAFAALASLVCGAWTAMKTRPGRSYGLLLAWTALAIPFSSWRGGSVSYLWSDVFYSLILLLTVGSAPRSYADIKKIFYAVLAASLFHIVVAGRTGEGGRFDLVGTFGNADDVALLAGFILPFWALFSTERKNSVLRAIFLTGGGLYLLYKVSLTGTRTVILGFGAVLAIYLVRSSAPRRLAALIGSLVVLTILLVALPKNVLERLGTITASFNEEELEAGVGRSEALDSSYERRELVKDGIHMTLTHPVFGVGPGQFGQYRWTNLNREGTPYKTWFPSHNTYVQIASESGIPALLLYIAFLVAIHRTIRSAFKLNSAGAHAGSELGCRIARFLEFAWVYFVVCAIFMTCDQHPHQFVLAGLAIALERVTKLEISRTTTPPLGIPQFQRPADLGRSPLRRSWRPVSRLSNAASRL